MSKRADGGYIFWLIKPSKRTSIEKPFHDVEIARFPASRNLCPVCALEEYIDRTRLCRGKVRSTMSQLLLSRSKPYHPGVSSTILRWLKEIMSLADIDTSLFKAHSTRGASTSAAARAGVATADILKTADWSSATTFANFYHRNSTSSEFGQAVLASAL